MAFRCPQCKTRDTLQIELALELPPSRQSEEASLQVIACRGCGFRGLAVYEERRGDCPESESWRHIGYWVSPDAVESVSSAIRACPEPRNPHCSCEAHVSLRKREYLDQWRGLLELERGHTFAMRMFSG
jgi:Zn ribbon nucleic-acid-binding protein